MNQRPIERPLDEPNLTRPRSRHRRPTKPTLGSLPDTLEIQPDPVSGINAPRAQVGIGELGRTAQAMERVWTRIDRTFGHRHHAEVQVPDAVSVTNGVLSNSESLLPPRDAPTVLSHGQKVVVAIGLVTLALALATAPLGTIVVVNGALVVFFIAANSMKLFLIHRSLTDPCDLRVNVEAKGRLRNNKLPIYTILLPLYREASVLDQLVTGILNLDYPTHRLDVKLLLEEDDIETRQLVSRRDLPDCFDVLVVPDVGPKGKPRACNYGLARARGKYLVIYDAEDRPEPDQLHKSISAFREAPEDVVCLQAKLNYFNRTHNVLTRWFTAEYSVWFDQLLPGLQSMDAVIPLGGTSNHFVTARLWEIGGWNAYNVTEDAELGVRIHLRGWKTAMLDTTTFEEATSNYHNWIRQRSRWVKGYMQTYLFHMRHPVKLLRCLGLRTFVAFQLFFGASTLCLLLNPVFWLLAGLWFASHLHVIQLVFPAPVLYVATIALFVGNGACILSVISGAFGRRHYEDVKWVVLAPFYWVLMSVGAYKALIQLFYKPSYWEKTAHGFCPFEPDSHQYQEQRRELEHEQRRERELAPIGAYSPSLVAER